MINKEQTPSPATTVVMLHMEGGIIGFSSGLSIAFVSITEYCRNMGLKSFLYIGRVCSKEDYLYLTRKVSSHVLAHYATKVSKRWYIIHAPGRCVPVDGHAVLKAGERREAFVTLHSLDVWWAENRPDDPCDWKDDIPGDHVARLRALLSLISRGDKDGEPGVYVCEAVSNRSGFAALTNIAVGH